MKKQRVPVLTILTITFAAFTVGFFLGRNQLSAPVTVSVPAPMQTVPTILTEPETQETVPEPTIVFPIDICCADKEEFMALPGIGEVLAGRILAYRDQSGGFSQVEDLLNVEGIGKKRFEDIYSLITIGG